MRLGMILICLPAAAVAGYFVLRHKDARADGTKALPAVWSSYGTVKSTDQDFEDLKAHGVGLVNASARTTSEAGVALEAARKHGMQYMISLPDVTEIGSTLRARGIEVEDALMIGGVYRGKAIDRHLFTFTASRQRILIEPPVYNKRFAYTLGSGATGPRAAGEPIGHYFPDMPAPVRAEVIVPLRLFDGRQHLKIVPAAIDAAEPGERPSPDSVADQDLTVSSEIRSRRLYHLSFDLTGLEGARLDRIGIAVYWPYGGTRRYWIFGKGTIPAASAATKRALRSLVRAELNLWSVANGGRFPSDVVRAVRYGDECFYITAGVSGEADAVNYPLWDYSRAGIDSFHSNAGAIQYPRTWGFPEVYGPDAYSSWLYTLHKDCAGLLDIVRGEVREGAPGLLLFRNNTRFGVFHSGNDHDGSGPELLVKASDIVHLDPYPVNARGYEPTIPRDMSYYAGLARRYGKLLVPWLQAHTYGGPTGLQDVTPEQVRRMVEEHSKQGANAIMWLGYGKGQTFPFARPDSWAEAGKMNAGFAADPPAKPKAQLAVIRSYRDRSLLSIAEGMIRNPADWILQQFLEVWAVELGRPYDVFELPPGVRSETLSSTLRQYPFVVATTDHPGAWRIGAGTDSTEIPASDAGSFQETFRRELRARGWVR